MYIFVHHFTTSCLKCTDWENPSIFAVSVSSYISNISTAIIGSPNNKAFFHTIHLYRVKLSPWKVDLFIFNCKSDIIIKHFVISEAGFFLFVYFLKVGHFASSLSFCTTCSPQLLPLVVKVKKKKKKRLFCKFKIFWWHLSPADFKAAFLKLLWPHSSMCLCSLAPQLVVKVPELANSPLTPSRPPPPFPMPSQWEVGLLWPHSFFHYEFICLQKKEAAGATWNPGALHQGL